MAEKNSHYLEQELYQLINSDPALFEFLQHGSLDGLWYWDLESPDHEWMNPAFWQLLGYDPAERKHLAAEWKDLIFPQDLELAQNNFRAHCADPTHPYDQIVRYRHKDGSTVWVRCRGIAFRDKSGKPIRMLGAHNDLTELKRSEQKLKQKALELEELKEKFKHLATHDDLTGLNNRLAFRGHFELMISNALRRNEPISTFMLDIDNFKVINDTFGHPKGDNVLQRAANIARDSDILARFGGEEFIFALPNTSVKASYEAAERVRRCVGRAEDGQINITVSIGIATFGPDVKNMSRSAIAKQLIERADKALYQAKQAGRNKVLHFTDLKLVP